MSKVVDFPADRIVQIPCNLPFPADDIGALPSIVWQPTGPPALIYFPDRDCFEFVTEDVTVVYDEVIPGVYLLKDIDGREVKGFKIEGTLIRFLLVGHSRSRSVVTTHEGKGADTP